ncbi:DUF4288 domain-containing protein [bacterium]|nr:DUF4288 domain-containing protein [bacterium]QQR59068.1 MAG: DUF4288 domain-containing protein [Candidatus Melainabacteria bacterium]
MSKSQQKSTKKCWFGVKTVYKFDALSNDCPDPVFEERVVLFRAVDFNQAINLAEEEALIYAKEGNCKFTGFVNAFIIADEPAEKIEVYSLMRTSKLSEQDYLDHYYDSGTELTQKQE